MRRTTIADLRRTEKAKARAEICDFCSAALAADHPHVMAPAERKISCACGACALLFSFDTGAKHRRIPKRVLYLADFHLTEAQWSRLAIPIGLAFFFYSSNAERIVALYPSPAGAAECALEFASWAEIARVNPILRDMEPDVEGLLVNRVRNDRQYYLAPIDECYKLVGLMRTYWHGLAGGAEVWRAIDGFFNALRQRAAGNSEAFRA